MILRHLTLLLIVLAIFTSCNREEENELNKEDIAFVNGTLTLNYGETQTFSDVLQVQFEELIEDSRCPLNAVCGWEGRATVRLLFIEGDAISVLELTKHVGHPELAIRPFGASQIELIAVNPHPIAGVVVTKEDYSIVLKIE